MRLRLAIPDMISNSYFPALGAARLGFFKKESLDVSVELVSPAGRAFAALRDGEVDLVAAGAHGALSAFPEWRGVKLLCALSQGMYWFLVMRSDLAGPRGDLSVVRGRRIAAAPSVDLGLRQLLRAAGFDPARDVEIGPLPGSVGPKVNIGVTVAQALADGRIDGFWANGMGAELVVKRGAGKVVLDVRRGDGPPDAFHYTFPALATTDRLAKTPEAMAAIRAIAATHEALSADPELAKEVAKGIFPEEEITLISELIRRDLPYYDMTMQPETIAALNRFARASDLLHGEIAYEDVVAAPLSPLWRKAPILAGKPGQ